MQRVDKKGLTSDSSFLHKQAKHSIKGVASINAEKSHDGFDIGLSIRLNITEKTLMTCVISVFDV